MMQAASQAAESQPCPEEQPTTDRQVAYNPQVDPCSSLVFEMIGFVMFALPQCA
jgi:hypothetical protein